MPTEKKTDEQFMALMQRYICLRPKIILHGDRAHVILDSTKWSNESLTRYLDGKGIKVNSIETVQSTLEDVFTLLAHRGKTGEAA